MKQRMWSPFFFMFFLISSVGLIESHAAYADAHVTSAEHGEEEYVPKSESKPAKKNTTDGIEYKSYPAKQDKAAQTHPETSLEEEDVPEEAPEVGEASQEKKDPKKELKDFTDKEGINNKNSAQPSKPKDEHANSDKQGASSEKTDVEKDIKVEANKLVDADEKIVEAKKYNGIIWFVVVFLVLLIVIFAFT